MTVFFPPPRSEYINITKDYPLRFAETLQQARSAPAKNKDDDDDDDNHKPNNNATKPFHFVYVSGEGANDHPGRFTPLFGRVKGEAERALGEFAAQAQAQQQPPADKSFHALAVRPAFVDPSAHAAIQPYLGGAAPLVAPRGARPARPAGGGVVVGADPRGAAQPDGAAGAVPDGARDGAGVAAAGRRRRGGKGAGGVCDLSKRRLCAVGGAGTKVLKKKKRIDASVWCVGVRLSLAGGKRVHRCWCQREGFAKIASFLENVY